MISLYDLPRCKKLTLDPNHFETKIKKTDKGNAYIDETREMQLNYPIYTSVNK